MSLLIGDYGIRAMGIDTLFNVGSNTEPTRLRIVAPEYDAASVIAAVIADCNLDGDMDDLFESGPIGDVTIFKNTTDNVVLTVTVNNRTAHPATVMVQYMDAAGAWQNIGELDLAGTETGSTFEVDWNVADFDALVDAGNTVMVRAVASNALQLTDPNPVEGAINLDAGMSARLILRLLQLQWILPRLPIRIVADHKAQELLMHIRRVGLLRLLVLSVWLLRVPKMPNG